MQTYQTPPTKKKPWLPALIGGCLVLFLCLGCLTLLSAAGLIYYVDQQLNAAGSSMASADREVSSLPPTDTPIPASATPPPPPATTPATLTPPPVEPEVTPEAKTGLELAVPAGIIQQPAQLAQFTHLTNFLAASYPTHDYYESAARLGSFHLDPRTSPAGPYQVGDVRQFFVDEEVINATLGSVTEHTYFWVQEGLDLDPIALTQAAERFENEYYPLVVNLIGPEWRPGIDEDPHFSVLHLDNEMGANDELGYFNSGDEFPNSFYSDSNEQEMLYLNMGNLTVGEDLYYGTLVHEFQHLAQWNVDGNETTWMDEGLAQMVELYVGLETASAYDYLLAPETQLNSWSYEDDVYAHYSASYLFMVYLWEQLGDAAIQEIARHPANGLAAVWSVLPGYQPELSLEQLLANWAAANYLDTPLPGREYNYERLDLEPVQVTDQARVLPFESVATVPQFGVHYIDLDTAGRTTISFAGDSLAELAPVSPHSGEQMWFVPPVDTLDATLTGRFDLAGLSKATLTFWTWYNLEPEYDFGYVSISTDEGQSWDLLSPDQARPGEYGPAFTGDSRRNSSANGQGWLPVSVSLNSYVGRTVLIRFEVLTDAAITEHGFAVDDIAIPELNYISDVESSNTGWEAAGFVQTGRWLPQQWSVQLVIPGREPQIIPMSLDALNQGQLVLDLPRQGGTLIIMPQTPFAPNPANYWLSVTS